MNFIGCIPRFVKAHAGWILTALGSAGLISTVIFTAKETPKVTEAIEDAESDKISEWIDENHLDAEDLSKLDDFPEEAYLTTWEKVKVATPLYLPSILSGLGTLACFWGAQIFNVRKQAGLIAAYGALVMQFDQYREAIKAEYGEEADRKAFEISQKRIEELKKEIERLKKENGPALYEFAWLPGVIFEERPVQVINSLMHFNRNLMLRGWNDLAELHRFFGLPESSYDKKEVKDYGWQLDENEVTWGATYVDFYFEKVKNRFGMEVNVIYTYIPPYEVNVDYGFEGDSTAREYSKYNIDMAKAFAEELGMDEIIKIDPNWECYTPNIC